ncbi:MAG: polyprenyl synthetase family protein [Betaproteobacteria bacterium]|nr:polyprenyl synthetase family protein [Betaproteobacteria bacterium]
MARIKARFKGRADFPVYWRAIKARLDTELARRIPEFFKDLAAGEIDTIRRILADGKRIRGCLVCLVSDALGGRIEDAIPRAVAIECIQAASLIHDDYVDEDTRRRERAATWTVEGPRRAVLLGDLMFATAIEKMMAISRQDGLAVAQAIATMASGAYREPMGPLDLARALTGGTYRPELYDRIIHLKTGALFGVAAKVGAVAARASPAMRTLAFEWGARVGEAYQIADDLEEVLTLEAHPEILPERISRLAPLFLRFSREENFQASYLSAEREADFREWFRNARPVMETRMRHEITARLDRAAKAVGDFPETVDTRWLRAAPSAIVRIESEST